MEGGGNGGQAQLNKCIVNAVPPSSPACRDRRGDMEGGRVPRSTVFRLCHRSLIVSSPSAARCSKVVGRWCALMVWWTMDGC